MVKLKFFILPVLFAIVIRCVNPGYCDFNSNHLLCGVEENKDCGKVYEHVAVNPTDNEIDEILKAHNSYRNYVASGMAVGGGNQYFPSAANMEELCGIESCQHCQ
ncbi:UNVERIFIED_CONTAM: hypothetical protein RMT77_018334 [Armadillidium vulgare]